MRRDAGSIESIRLEISGESPGVLTSPGRGGEPTQITVGDLVHIGLEQRRRRRSEPTASASGKPLSNAISMYRRKSGGSGGTTKQPASLPTRPRGRSATYLSTPVTLDRRSLRSGPPRPDSDHSPDRDAESTSPAPARFGSCRLRELRSSAHLRKRSDRSQNGVDHPRQVWAHTEKPSSYQVCRVRLVRLR